jgi:hypothetical protein
MRIITPLNSPEPTYHGNKVNWLYVVEVINERCYTDNLPELVDLFVDGYLRNDLEYDPSLHRSLLRTQALMEEASRKQQEMSVGVSLDLRDSSSFYLDVLASSKAIPFEGRLTPDGEEDYNWDCPTSLILIRTDYEPYTSRPLPTGNTIYVDASSDESFLRSLELLGVCRFIDRSQERTS